MVAVDSDHLISALARLDPGSRALLDLSLRRGLDDAEIADFLGTEPADVADRRSRVVEGLAREAGATTTEEVAQARRMLVDLDPSEWGAARPAAEPRDEEPEGPRPAPRRDPNARPTDRFTGRADEVRERGRRGGLLVAGLLALAVLGVVIAILASSAGDDEGKTTASTSVSTRETSTSESTTTTGTAASTQTTSAGEPVRLRSLADRGSATAVIDGDRLMLKVKDLPEPTGGSYEIWLYNSIEDAESIASFDRTSIDLDARLPADRGRFRYLDVSFEPKDDNANHSGESILRAPLSRLGAG